MHFTFTKYVIKDHFRAGYGRLERCAMYTVYNGDDKVGAFFYSDEVSWLAFDEEDLRIDYIRKLFHKTRYQIVDQKTNAIVGNYNNVSKFFSYFSLGKLYLSKEKFHSYKLVCGKKTSFANQSSIQHFKLKVGNQQQEAIYIFRTHPIDKFQSSFVGDQPLTGTIEYESNNHFLLMAGFFLVQKILEAEEQPHYD